MGRGRRRWFQLMATGKIWRGGWGLLNWFRWRRWSFGEGSGDTHLQRSKSAEARAETSMCSGQVIGERSVWLDHSRSQGDEAGWSGAGWSTRWNHGVQPGTMESPGKGYEHWLHEGWGSIWLPSIIRSGKEKCPPH